MWGFHKTLSFETEKFNLHSILFLERCPNRVIEIDCFDSKLQKARNTCERKQAKRDVNVCHANGAYKLKTMTER